MSESSNQTEQAQTEQTTEEHASASQASLKVTPGSLLRAAREAKGLSLDDIAARQRLSLRVIRDIEADAYRHFEAETYLYGYFRGYARQVGLNPDDVIQAFKDLNIVLRPKSERIALMQYAKAIREPARPAAARRSSSRIAAGTWLTKFTGSRRWLFATLAVLILLGLAIWWGQHQATLSPGSLAMDGSGKSVQSVSLPDLAATASTSAPTSKTAAQNQSAGPSSAAASAASAAKTATDTTDISAHAATAKSTKTHEKSRSGSHARGQDASETVKPNYTIEPAGTLH